MPEGPDGMTVKGRYPTRAGWFVIASRWRLMGAEAGPDEGWLISARGRELVLTGSIDDSREATDPASPDGCKVAFRYAPTPLHRAVRAVVVDLCASLARPGPHA